MTDQIDDDLRRLLAERAAAVTPDVARGEAAIATRLAAGDADLADVVSLTNRSRRRPLALAAAAAVVIATIGAAVLFAEDDQSVDTGPVATAPPTAAPVLEFRTVLAVGSCEELGLAAAPALRADDSSCYLLGAPRLVADRSVIEAVGRFASFSSTGAPIGGCEGATCEPTTTTSTVEEEGLTLTLTEDGIGAFNALAGLCFSRTDACPTGRLAVVLDGAVLSAPSIVQPTFDREELMVVSNLTPADTDELVRRITAAIAEPAGPPGPTPEDAADPTIGAPGDAAKDVAERVMREVLGDESVTTGAEDDGDRTLVTLETSTGSAVEATVVFDVGIDAFRLTSLASPGLGGELTAAGELFVAVPAPGSLRVRGFTDDLRDEVDATPPGGTAVQAGRQGPLPLPAADYVWLVLRLETGDGRVLWALSRR